MGRGDYPVSQIQSCIHNRWLEIHPVIPVEVTTIFDLNLFGKCSLIFTGVPFTKICTGTLSLSVSLFGFSSIYKINSKFQLDVLLVNYIFQGRSDDEVGYHSSVLDRYLLDGIG